MVTALNRSSVGLKVLMAVTGGLLVLFLVAHMLGNLKIFFGPATFDHYAHWLRTIGTPVLPPSWYLWIQRAVLSVAVVAHIWSAAVLTGGPGGPVRCATRTAAGAGQLRGPHDALGRRDHRAVRHLPRRVPGRRAAPVRQRRRRLRRWPVTLFYIVAIVAVGFHLRHGIFSALRTLGLRRRAGRGPRRCSVVLCAGFLSVPFAVLIGLVR